MWCRFLPDPATAPPRVAFAIGRAVGTAVTRNRLRRRLRALVADAAATGVLAPGWLLVGARPAAPELTYEQLAGEVLLLLRTVDRAGGR